MEWGENVGGSSRSGRIATTRHHRDGWCRFVSVCLFAVCQKIINLLLTEREGRTGEYWPEVVAVRTERSEVRTKTTEGQYSPVRLELARLVSSLLYGTRAMLVFEFSGFRKQKIHSL